MTTPDKCADCNKPAVPPYDNGDDKVRCEECAVAKYKTTCPSGVPIIIKHSAFVRETA